MPRKNPLSEAAAALGRKGGQAKTSKPKGLAALSKKRRMEIAQQGSKAAAKQRAQVQRKLRLLDRMLAEQKAPAKGTR
jgi:hypothetical protein